MDRQQILNEISKIFGQGSIIQHIAVSREIIESAKAGRINGMNFEQFNKAIYKSVASSIGKFIYDNVDEDDWIESVEAKDRIISTGKLCIFTQKQVNSLLDLIGQYYGVDK